MIKEIPLTKGAVAIIGDEDYGLVSQYKWKYSSHGYAVRGIYVGTFDGKPKYTSQSMHRLIMGNPEGMVVDHINGNRLDNRKENLRVCTSGQNQMNSPKSRGGISKYKGVTYCKRHKKWVAQIKSGKKHSHLGYFSSEDEAALVYNSAALILHGEYANINNIK